MARQRSPNYPATDLAQAVADAKAIYNREQRAIVPLEVAAKALSYKSLSGPARSRIAALRSYGLVDSIKGGIRLSDRAMTLILRTPPSSEWTDAARAAALEPDIFRELHGSHLTASDENLQHYLIISRSFTGDGARKLTESFRLTMRYAKLGFEGYPEDHGEGPEPMTIQATQPTDFVPSIAEPSGPPISGGSFRYPLRKGVTAEVRLSGAGISPKDLSTLIKYLELARDTWADEQEPDDES